MAATDAESVVTQFLTAALGESAADPTKDSSLDMIAEGAILSEIANQRQELEANGWTISGSPTVVWAVIDEQASDSSATVSACIDSSAVVTKDSSGVPLSTESSAHRAINIFTLESATDSWRVTARTFPDNPTC